MKCLSRIRLIKINSLTLALLCAALLSPVCPARQAQRAPAPPAPVKIEIDPDSVKTDPRDLAYEDPNAPSGPAGVVAGAGAGVSMGVGTGQRPGYGPGRGTWMGGGGPGVPGGGGPPDQTRTYTQHEVTRKAMITSRPEPAYTEKARRNNVHGTVLLRVTLHWSGVVKNISVVKGLPDGLSERAVEAAKKIQFDPAEIDGRKVSQAVLVQYDFNLY